MLADVGFEALLVGGCVRNALLNEPINDIDIATDARPEQVIKIARDSGLKPIPTGISHGTVTVIANGTPFEITTFRQDVETDGRRANVSFSNDVTEDAGRRDFTMNALYAQADGTVVDPLEGMPDILTRRIRFVGSAENRITEDFLRILRFFRFHAWYGDPSAGIDADGLAASAANADGLATLSRERVGAELIKLLGAPDPAPSVASMRRAGVLQAVLPGVDDAGLALLIHHEQAHYQTPDALRRLACIGGEGVDTRLRLSNGQARQLHLLRDEVGQGTPPAELAYRHGRKVALDILLLRAALFEQGVDLAGLTDLEAGAAAVFPVSARDLMPQLMGAKLGAALSRLEREWIGSGFALSRQELIDRL